MSDQTLSFDDKWLISDFINAKNEEITNKELAYCVEKITVNFERKLNRKEMKDLKSCIYEISENKYLPLLK
jgi:hypothetical protein